jgi:saccharopepsin
MNSMTSMNNMDIINIVKRWTSEPLTSAAQNELFAYVGSIEYGSPAIAKSVIFDSGSCQFWVMQDPKAGGITVEGAAPLIQYYDGTVVEGNFAKATVSIGNMTFTDLMLEQATSISSSFTTDGLIGMCYQSDGQSSNPLLREGVSRGLMKTPSFGYHIDADGQTAEVVLDGVDSSKFIQPFKFSPVDTSSYYWQINLAAISTSDGSVAATNLQYPAVVDTGTSTLILPNSIATSINNIFGFPSTTSSLAGGTCPFSQVGDITLNITFTGASLSIPLKYLLANVGGNYCYSTVISGSDGNVVLGNAFLRYYYTFFDGGNNQVGFAERNVSNWDDIVGGSNAPNNNNGTSSPDLSPLFDNGSPTLLFFIAMAAAGVGIGIIIYVSTLLCRRRRRNDEYYY